MKKILSIMLFILPLQGWSQSFEWVLSNPIAFSLNPSYPEQPLCSGNGNTVWSSRLDSSIQVFGTEVHGNTRIENYQTNGSLNNSRSLEGEVCVHDIKESPAGELIVAGSFLSNIIIDQQDTLFHSGLGLNNEQFLLCFNNQGAVKWKRNLNPGTINSENLRSLGISHAGDVYYSIDDFNSGLISRLDSAGNDAWTVNISGIRTISDFGFDPNDNIFLTGSTGSGSVFTIGNLQVPATEPYMLYIARVNTSGQGVWVRLGHDITFQLPHLVTDNQGNAYVSAYLMDTLTWGSHFLSGPDWVYDFFLAKVDSNGFFPWAREIPNSLTGITGDFMVSSHQSIACDSSGGIALLGTIRGTVDWGNGVISTPQPVSNSGIHVVFFDSAGIVHHSITATSTNFKAPHDIIYSNNGWVLSSSHNGPETVGFDPLSHTFSNPQNTCLSRIGPVTVSVGELSGDNQQDKVYPNPSSGIFNLPGEWMMGQRLDIFDVSGRLLESYPLVPGQIDLGKYDPGIYILLHKGESRRIILQRE